MADGGAASPVPAVDVWWTLDVVRFASLGAHLQRHEHAGAARLRRPADRQRLIARRGLLRTVLAGYLDMAPAAIRFELGPYGKPKLARSGRDLQFSLARSRDAAMLAVAEGHPVGIDVEWVRPGIDLAAVARTACTAAERAVLATVPASGLGDAFATLWVHKEAVAKGDGRGLSLAPADIDVTSALADGVARVAAPGDPQRGVWRSQSLGRLLSLPSDLPAAIAVPDSLPDVQHRITSCHVRGVDDVRAVISSV